MFSSTSSIIVLLFPSLLVPTLSLSFSSSTSTSTSTSLTSLKRRMTTINTISTRHRHRQPLIRLLLSNNDSTADASTITKKTSNNNIEEPDENESSFGRMGYWDESYRQAAAASHHSDDYNNDDNDKKEQGGEATITKKDVDVDVDVYSWYCGWEDELGPFFTELFPDRKSLILIPGIGNDICIRDMYDIGEYHRIMAFDYAPQGVECAKKMFGNERIQTIEKETNNKDVFRVCDGRDLSLQYNDSMFDGVLDKGTLDSIYLSGGKDKIKSKLYLSMAVKELKRIVKIDGIVFSVTAACVDSVRDAFTTDGDTDTDNEGVYWKPIRDGSLHITEDGYTSNNVDATMLAWQLTRRGKTTNDTTT
jgi:hypothetical protein